MSFSSALSGINWLAVVAAGCILFWRQLEEEKLITDYGETYQKYRASTWF